MNGRTVVITGATTGIGKESARQLLGMGADVVIVARDPAKIDAAEKELLSERPSARLSHVRCDFASLQSVRAAGAELAARHAEIHVLLNNAGALHTERQTTEDGHELTFQTNHLASFLLTHLLLPTLRRSGTPSRKARVVNVASRIHTRGKIDLGDLESTARYTGMSAYAASKLMNVMTTFALSRRLAGEPVTANCLHPGVIGSGFGHNNRGLFGLGVKLVRPFLKTPAQGARANVFLSSAAEVEGVTGKYFDDAARERRAGRTARIEAVQNELWDVTEGLLGLS